MGTTALVGAIQYLRRGQSNPRMALVFGLPAIVGVYVTRRFIFPAVPDPVFSTEAFVVSKDVFIMIFFAAFMLIMSISMIRSQSGLEQKAGGVDEAGPAHRNLPVIGALGLGVGLVTGFVGAGGGFMILPVLVLMAGLQMKVAIGTGLMIIAAKSLVGFIGEVQVAEEIDFGFLGMLAVLPFIGIILGWYLNRLVPAHVLRTAFGWFVLVMGVYIVSRELVFG